MDSSSVSHGPDVAVEPDVAVAPDVAVGPDAAVAPDLAVARIAAGQDGVVTARQCLAAGMRWPQVTRRCRSGAWRGVFRGVYYVHGGSPEVPMRARIRAGVLALGPDAVATLTSAAHLHGLPFTPQDGAVHAAVSAERNRLDQPGLVVRQLVVTAADRTVVDGVPATSRERTLADLTLRLSRFDAVAMLDGALHQGVISDGDLLLIAAHLRRRRGAVRARRRLAEADGRAASPLETRLRLVCVDGGVPPEAVQLPILDDDGRLLAVADLAWPSRRLLVEADGRLVHAAPEALYHDRRRQNDLAARGWTVIRFTWADLSRPGYVVNAVRRTLARQTRTLTAEQPATIQG
jgi:hypothetical protein